MNPCIHRIVAFTSWYVVFGDLGFVAYEGKVFEFGFGWGFWVWLMQERCLRLGLNGDFGFG